MVNFSLAGRVFVNMLTAHKEAYKLIKSLPGEGLSESQVQGLGFHNLLLPQALTTVLALWHGHWLL